MDGRMCEAAGLEIWRDTVLYRPVWDLICLMLTMIV